jgi:hypothetical protein
MNAFCASENLDAFIVLRSFPAAGNDRKTLASIDPVFRDQSNPADKLLIKPYRRDALASKLREVPGREKPPGAG